MIKALRSNIGTIVAGLGFVLLCILTFGDIGEVLSIEYWRSVRNNLSSIGFLSLGLTMIQVSIKQGVSEQALQKGLNTVETTGKYTEHRGKIKSAADRMLYLPYFLQNYNERMTTVRRREFLADNDFTSEQKLYSSGSKRLIRKYEKICTHQTGARIKWASTEIIYNKKGQIQTLAEHRTKRTIRGTTMGVFFMLGATLLARGLFFENSDVTLGEKFVKLLSYVLMIAMTSIFPVIKEYEKGAFGVPNELEEINEIWTEFLAWPIPDWVKEEVENSNEKKEVLNEKAERSDGGTDLSSEQEKS